MLVLLKGKKTQIALDVEMIYRLDWNEARKVTDVMYQNQDEKNIVRVDCPIEEVTDAINSILANPYHFNNFRPGEIPITTPIITFGSDEDHE